MRLDAGIRARNQVSDIALATCTTMRIGGPALLVSVECRDDLPALLAAPHRLLGKGANLLVDDAGVAEPVLRLGQAFAGIAIGEPGADGRTCVRVGAAADLAELLSRCVKAGLAGPEGLAGVPATVGGAVRMNAGTTTTWTLDHVRAVEVICPGDAAPRWLPRADLAAAYRQSGLPPGALVLAAEFALAAGDPATLRATATRLKQAKAASQPLALPSAGCVFRNPAPQLPAGKLIDELGLKGTRIGGAEISRVHGNFIVNPERRATSADVYALIRLIRARAFRERGVVLDLEIETWNSPADLRLPPNPETSAATAAGTPAPAALAPAAAEVRPC